MSNWKNALRRSLLPASVFLAVVIFHFCWIGYFPERNPQQVRWISVTSESQGTWLRLYLASQAYWLGLSYASSIVFAACALRAHRERACCAAGRMALGGLSFSGALAVAGCYLLGCCGSPMLTIYVSLFGSTFLSFAKPLVACVTLISLIIAWWWMKRQAGKQDACDAVHPKARSRHRLPSGISL